MRRKYPIGLQSFREIRENDYLYVDKTKHIHALVTSGKYYFLSRPRRFGKSLLLNTIKELFSGNQELFKGLWVENRWNWEKKHPVIHLKISQTNYQKLGLYDALNKELDAIALEWAIELQETNLKDKFRELIRKAGVREQVVILIDEYDKAIIDYLDNPAKQHENRQIFKSFYSVLKDSDDYIRLLLVTGVSRFSKVSIFSDLNNLEDISLSGQMSTLTGITQEELETVFDQELEALALRDGITRQQITGTVKEWYNGYSWDGINRVYNPFSLLLFMKQGRFDNFWIDTGTPTFLLKDVRENPSIYVAREEDLQVGIDTLKDLDADNPDPVSLMFQTGFLTIKEINWLEQLVVLSYPNREVRQSVLSNITAAYSYEQPGLILPMVSNLRTAFIRNDIPYVIRVFDTLFVNIPNPLWINAKEAFYHGIIINTFQLLGVHQESEIFNAHGRVDVLVKTKDYIFALEFKLDKSAEEALQQIVRNGYLKQPYLLDPRRKFAIGINFSAEKKAVAAYLVKEIVDDRLPLLVRAAKSKSVATCS